MQYNIFKVRQKERLFVELEGKNFIRAGNIKNINNYQVYFYYKKNVGSGISWQNILDEFGVDVTIERENLQGILFVEQESLLYAITYGMSSSLVQKYCDNDFAMDIAKRVNISKVKRKAAKFLNGSTNSLVKTLSNSNIVVVDKGESVVNLEILLDESEELGKIMGIGKSIKVNLEVGLEDINTIIDSINEIEQRNPARPIPLFVKVKDNELVDQMWDYLNDDFISKLDDIDFTLDEMNVLGSSIYFDDFFNIELSFYTRKVEVVELSTEIVKEFIKGLNIDERNVLDLVKIRYNVDGEFKFSKNLKEVVTFNFKYNDVNYVTYDGDIYFYNDDFYQNIKDGLSVIEFRKYVSSDDKNSEWYRNYLSEKNYADVRDSQEKKTSCAEVTYREKALNNVLSEKYDFENLDRNLVDINKDLIYKIEIADLGKVDNILYAVKVGTSRDFCYAIDQSNLSVDALISRTYNIDENIERYRGVKEIGLWLYYTGTKNLHNENNDIDISKLDSIMFLNKLVDWANKVVSANMKPVVVINYYR